MNIHVLVENNSHEAFKGEHGLSLFLEIGELKILFDTGQSSLFIKNAVKMGVDVHTANFVVLSHGHYDHGNGLEYLINKELVCHIGSFVQRFRKADDHPIGLPLSLQEAQKRFTLRMSSAPIELYPKVYFMGEIERVYSFERPKAFSYLESGQDDPILDDSALVIKTEEGNVIITGCSHSGICNIVRQAITITGDVRTYAIFGGFHLKKVNDQVRKTIDVLRETGVKHLYPVHCTSQEVVNAIRLGLPEVNVQGVTSGQSLTVTTR